MKRLYKKRIKQALSAILASAMSLSLFTTIPASAEIGKKTYRYDGYSVDYNVTNEWDGAQTVELTVSNTGTESILNWALKYDAEGEISNLWNADLYEQNGDEYVIKNVGWNFEIAPKQSVTYGYTLSGDNISMPKNFEIYSKRVDKAEGYDVQYNITKSWDVGVEGNIVITNTSAAPIEAWTLSFDSNFTIDNLWNGRVLENNGTSYTVAAEMWTNPVQPNSSMTIGFVGSKAADVEALLNNFRLTEVVIGEGGIITPDPKLEITANAAYDEASKNITVSWSTNNPNGVFDILMSVDGKNYISVGTVENASEFVYTPEGDSETLYFKVIQTADNKSAESNVVTVANSADNFEISANAVFDKESGNIAVSWLTSKENGSFEIFVSEDGDNYTSVGVVENTTEFVYTPEKDFETLYFKVVQTAGSKSAESNVVKVSGSETALDIIAGAYYDEDSSNIRVIWITNNENGTFEVFMSEDDENFTSLGTVENTKEFIYTPDGEFEVLYFKVKQTVDTEFAESESVAAYYPIDWEDETDTDNDGLTDVYEKYYFETDPTNPDTDGDGLPDGYEVYYLGTDPTKADTDDNGISDGDEDFDKDGLSNLREYELGTDPNSADSDSDGLIDGEEVNKYNTDPLKVDTDDDGVTDKDEIDLGLDPTNASTDGIPDNERTFEQSVGADTDNFASVNTDENPFKVSVDVTAAGVAANNLYADESGYAAFVSNEAILGITPEFFYNDNLKVEKITINFDIDSDYVANTNGKYVSVSDEFVGIKRFNVFKYFDDINMLLPIETFHDVANNRVYANVDEMGTYCLIDMEIWFEKLGVEPKSAEPQVMALSSEDASSFKVSTNDNLDVIIVLYTSSPYLDHMKSELITTADEIFKKAEEQNVSARIHYVAWTGGVYLNANTGEDYAENLEDVTAMINRSVVINTAALSSTDYMLTKAISGIKNNVSGNLQENSKKYCFIVDAGCSPACSTTHYGIQALQEQGYDFSFIYAPGNYNVANYNAISSNNSCFQIQIKPGRMMFSDFVIEHIFAEEEAIIIKSNDFERLPDDFGEISTTSTQDYDGDGVPDVDEIDWETINNYSVTTYSLQKSNKYLVKYKTLALDKNVNLAMKRYHKPNWFNKDIEDTEVIIVQSDPTTIDTDRDGFDDGYEYRNKGNKDKDKDFDLMINRHDKTIVKDSTIDDSYAFATDGSKATEDVIYNNCDGIELQNVSIKDGEVIENGAFDYKKNVLSYTRGNHSLAEYSLKPDKNSDYTIKLTTPTYEHASISIEREIPGIFKPTYIPMDFESKSILEGNSIQITTTVALEKGKTYRIKVNGLNENRIYDEYMLSFEQDNWVYAEYGGYAEYYIEESSYSETQTKYFMSRDLVYDTIYNYCTIRFGDTLPESFDEYLETRVDTGIRGDFNNQFYSTCERDVDYLIACFSCDDETKKYFDSIMNWSGIGLAFTSVVLIAFPQAQFFAAVVTIAGTLPAEYTIADIFNNISLEKEHRELIDALYYGKYSICISEDLHMTKFTTDFNAKYKKQYSSWDNIYINRYNSSNVRGNVEPFNMEEYVNEDNGGWKLIS